MPVEGGPKRRAAASDNLPHERLAAALDVLRRAATKRACAMELAISRLVTPPIEDLDIEVVERKGLGHPDSICDALAEELSLALCRFYDDRFGLVLHHNVDKALLWGGSARPAFGGGRVIKPFEFFIAGRATDAFRGVKVPVEELAVESSRDWLRQNLHAFDPDAHAEIHSLVRPGSADLVELFLRQQRTGVRLSNDTSAGVGYAPLSELETVVLQVERHLNSRAVKLAHPEIGEDIKIMGIRHGDTIRLTIGCAMIGRHVADIGDYRDKTERVREIAVKIARRFTRRAVSAIVNAADDIAAESVFLTVTGTSAEAGDDGEAGRGNRTNGLITPYRPMTMESVAGKNPITHVGKLYNLVAGLVAAALVEEVPDVEEAQCRLVSRIGHPLDDPQIADIGLRLAEPGALEGVKEHAADIVTRHLARIDSLWSDILAGEIAFNRWPLAGAPNTSQENAENMADQRQAMVREIEAEAKMIAGLEGLPPIAPEVMAAMGKVPRHEFVLPSERSFAYYNGPLPIGHGQTISQPYIVALMTTLMDVSMDDVVLEVGTGSGYQAAVLAGLVRQVYTVEVVEPLAEQAKACLQRLGYANVEARASDGYLGWPEHAPFDAIIVTAAAREVPPPLVEQLKPGGRLVIPLEHGGFAQDLVVIEKSEAGEVRRRSVLPVAFVPLTRRRGGPG